MYNTSGENVFKLIEFHVYINKFLKLRAATIILNTFQEQAWDKNYYQRVVVRQQHVMGVSYLVLAGLSSRK